MKRLFLVVWAIIPIVSCAQNSTLQVATTSDSIPQSTIVPTLGEDYTVIDSLKKDWPCIDYVVGTYAKHHFGEIISAVEDKKDAIPADVCYNNIL